MSNFKPSIMRRLLLMAGLVCSTAGHAAGDAFDFSRSVEGWHANSGQVDIDKNAATQGASGGALRWAFSYSSEATFIVVKKHLDRFDGMHRIVTRLRSDRAGPLMMRFDTGNGGVFFTAFEVGTQWTEVSIVPDALQSTTPGKSFQSSDIKALYFVDLQGSDQGAKGDRTVWIDHVLPAAAAKSSALPTRRTFFMAMTPWPYDLSEKAVRDTYAMLDKHTDMVAHHFDEGVPWSAALQGSQFHPEVEKNITYRLAQLAGKKIYLALTPVNAGRNELAGNWGKETNEKREGNWRKMDFDDADAINAYLAFCRRMIDRFKPLYFNYGIEANILLERNEGAFDAYLRMSEQVYKTLKAEYPDLPVFVSIHLDSFQKDLKKQAREIRKLLAFSDYVTVSTYPYSAANRGGKTQTHHDPRTLPKNWFTQLRDLAPEKPFAIAETGFQAQDFDSRKYGIHIPGNARWQEDYLHWLFREANAMNSEFLVWFVARDYDQFWTKLEKMGVDDAFKTWKDTGLLDEKGQRRPAMDLWDQWLALGRGR